MNIKYVRKYNYKLLLKLILVAIILSCILLSINLWLYYEPSSLELTLIDWLKFDGALHVNGLMQFISDSVIALIIFCGGYSLLLLVLRKFPAGIVLTLSLAALLLILPIKEVFQRPRPLMDPLADPFFGTSFPSAHAFTALLLSSIVVLVLVRTKVISERKIWLLLVAAYSLLVGWSRVYLGAHYPSDIIGGYILAGLLIVLLAFIFVRLTEQFNRD